MCRVVSSDDGYSFCLDEEGYVLYKTGEHMTGQNIAINLNISKAAVSGILKRSIAKLLISLKRKYFDLSTLEIVGGMAYLFNVNTEKQYRDFIKLFSEKIRRELYEEAYKKGYIRN